MNPPVKLFSDRSHYRRTDRMHLADILRPFWKDAPFSEEARQAMYGISSDELTLADGMDQADLAVLPMTWNHYLGRGLVNQARQFIERARRASKPVLSYVGGDEGVPIPTGFDDVFVVRASGTRSQRRRRQIAQPTFFEDPRSRYPDLAEMAQPATANGVPVVGFCGQASDSPAKLAFDVLRTGWRNLLHQLGRRHEESQPLYPSSLLRSQALKALASSHDVQTRFVVRAKYRGGERTPGDREWLTREFYANIAETDCTLCVRGGGNFSKRFYETLAMGRIPVLLDTDCLLPFEPDFNWDDYIIRVPCYRMRALPRMIAQRFAKLGPLGVTDLKRACRRLWQERLTFAGFHRYLVRSIVGAGIPALA